ncbi:MAG: M48 family metallopeptidase [Methanobrevibacter sp.]|jgi:predicted metal-dependent hydrolase|nr:M48 family metallopeptidase [Methanobrevibacter sp.]
MKHSQQKKNNTKYKDKGKYKDEFGANMTKYKIIYSKRKTISLKIKENGDLEVRAPNGTSKNQIAKFVESKEKWVNKHIHRIKENYIARKDFNLKFGDEIYLRGKGIAISPVSGKIAKYKDEAFLIPKNCNKEEIREIAIKLYKKIAKKHIKERISYFKEKMNVEPTGIRITSAKTRWGSCSGKNTINFSWKLIMADDEVIDYVIVHELAHIKEHNHSPNFWLLVESIIPDYVERKKKLKKLGEKLNKENWD